MCSARPPAVAGSRGGEAPACATVRAATTAPKRGLDDELVAGELRGAQPA